MAKFIFQPDSTGRPAEIPVRIVQDSPAVGAHLEHPARERPRAWELNSQIHSETMKIAVTRYLGRTIGAVLEQTTQTAAQAKEKISQIAAENKAVPYYSALLERTVAALLERREQKLGELTTGVFDTWSQITESAGGITGDKSLGAMVGVLRKGVNEMMDALLVKPDHSDYTQLGSLTGDTMMRVEFNPQGDIKTIQITMLAGRFSRAFESHLYAASQEGEDREQKRASVSVRKQRTGGDGESFFKVYPDDVRRAFFEATLDYAVQYADAIRERGWPPES